jgi:hypothetical protein
MLHMNHIKTIGMLVLAVSAVMAAATFVLPSMTMDAHAQQCASSASSVSGSAASGSSAQGASGQGANAQPARCSTEAQASPAEEDDD